MADSSVDVSTGHNSSQPQVIKAIVERDYTDRTHIRFFESCPVRILPLVSADVVKSTVRQINEILKDLTKYGGTKEVLENTASALSLYLANQWLPHGSKSCLDRLTAFIEKENETVYRPLGLTLINPVTQALLQLEFQAAVFEKGQLPSWKDINLVELIKFVWSKEGSVFTKRDGAEVLIEMSSRLKEAVPAAASKILTFEVERDNFGVADFELRSLLVQFLFNMRKIQSITRCLTKSTIYSTIIRMTAASIEEDTRCMIDRAKDIVSLPLVELHYAMKIYSRPSTKTANIMADFNSESLGMNVVEPVGEDPILIEILYSSIESWSVQNENTVGDAFSLELHLMNSAKCKLCFENLSNLALAKARLIELAPAAPSRKISIALQPSQNYRDIEVSNLTEATLDDQGASSSPPPLSEDINFETPKPSTQLVSLAQDIVGTINTLSATPKDPKIRTTMSKTSANILTPPLTDIKPLSKKQAENDQVCPFSRAIDSDIALLKRSLEAVKAKFAHKIEKKLKKHQKVWHFHVKKRHWRNLIRPRLSQRSFPELNEIRVSPLKSFAGVKKYIGLKLNRDELTTALLK